MGGESLPTSETHKVKRKSVATYGKSLDFVYKMRYNSIESITRER